MFCSQKSNNLIHRIHERALRRCTENEKLTFGELLSHTDSVFVPVRNFRFLITEVYNFINGSSLPTLQNFSTIRKNPKNLRNYRELEMTNKNTNLYVIETVNCKTSQL